MKKYILVLLSIALILSAFSGCAKSEEMVVRIYMWGGNESINQYIDGFVSDNMKEQYGITVERVPMLPNEYIPKLIQERDNDSQQGTIDVVWINAENFKWAMDEQLLYGPFTDELESQDMYYDKDAVDLNYDVGIPISGYEAIWGRAQFVLTYDEKELPSPPKSYAELLEWAKENPGRFTYPQLPEFMGSAFVRNAYYELTGQSDIFQTAMTREEFEELSEPVMTYFKELNQYLWNDGKAYPAGQAQLDELFKNGEVLLTMGFEVGKTTGLVNDKTYTDTTRTYVFDTGTIGNAHYLAIPFNAPNKEGAVKLIDFLESPEAQIEKLKPEVWGDMLALDIDKLDETQKEMLSAVKLGVATLSSEQLAAHRNADMNYIYYGWIEELWAEQVGGQ